MLSADGIGNSQAGTQASGNLGAMRCCNRRFFYMRPRASSYRRKYSFLIGPRSGIEYPLA